MSLFGQKFYIQKGLFSQFTVLILKLFVPFLFKVFWHEMMHESLRKKSESGASVPHSPVGVQLNN